ncbi:MAG TPA: pseudouridine synthase [Dissulfurispiraceae bacterium]|nr:pseudouridine synthase [Dissulfurispiraceae bacterium]
MKERIQKIVAQAGIASRRAAEELILAGRVTVNGQPASLGMKADPLRDHVKVDGKLITRREPKVYYLFYKPRGVVTSLVDPAGRPTVKDYFAGTHMRVFPVGRLDFDSEGLLFVTNDGDFANAVLHPSQEMPKTYAAKVKGEIADEDLVRLREGVRLEDGMTAPARTRRIRTTESNCWIQITIHEGRNRQVRRMLEKVGHPVIRLKRVAIGSFGVGALKPGQYRELTKEEVQTLFHL